MRMSTPPHNSSHQVNLTPISSNTTEQVRFVCCCTAHFDCCLIYPKSYWATLITIEQSSTDHGNDQPDSAREQVTMECEGNEIGGQNTGYEDVEMKGAIQLSFMDHEMSSNECMGNHDGIAPRLQPEMEQGSYEACDCLSSFHNMNLLEPVAEHAPNSTSSRVEENSSQLSLQGPVARADSITADSPSSTVSSPFQVLAAKYPGVDSNILNDRNASQQPEIKRLVTEDIRERLGRSSTSTDEKATQDVLRRSQEEQADQKRADRVASRHTQRQRLARRLRELKEENKMWRLKTLEVQDRLKSQAHSSPGIMSYVIACLHILII